MKRVLPVALVAAAALAGCAAPVASPTPTPEPSPTLSPTANHTQTPISTPICTPTPTATPTPTETPTSAPTSTPTATPTELPVYDVALSVFNDRNTNSVQEAGEPSLSLEVCLDGLCAVSDGNGSAFLQGVPAGRHDLSVSYGELPFYNESLEHTVDLRVACPVVTVNDNLEKNLGLSAGLFPFLVRCADMANVPQASGLPEVMRYVEPGHQGVDFRLTGDVAIAANVSGTVYAVVQVHRPSGYYANDWMVVIQSGEKTFFYGHLQTTSVAPGQTVLKGDLIGHSVQSLYPSVDRQHIHFELQEGFPDNPVVIDPFNSDLSRSLWSVPNTPVCF